MRWILLATLFLALPAAAQESEETGLTLEDVAARLSEPQVLRGRFSQTRDIALLSRPLESSGIFILSAKGLYWEQQQPFSSVLIADGERLAQRLADGPLITMDSSRQPLVLSFSKIFLNMFRGEHADLEQHFSIRFQAEVDAWKIDLKPTSFPLSEGISNIKLSGRDHIDLITVNGSDLSDTMTISFSALQTSPPALTEHETELYAW